jgi:hypothetical protein
MNSEIPKKRLKSWPKPLFLAALLLGLVIGFPVVDDTIPIPKVVVGDAEAGYHHSTRRRVTRGRFAPGTVVAHLPLGCGKVYVRGVITYVCSGTYYQPYYEGSTVVYVVIENP